MNYLGLDLSLSCSGFAVVRVEDRQPTLVTSGNIKTNPKSSHGMRLLTIYSGISAVDYRYSPFAQVVREKGFSMHAATTQALFKVVGVADMYFAQIGHEEPMIELAPTTVKKIMTGNGKADKAEVAEAVREALGLHSMYRFISDDASDACAVILSYLKQQDLVD